MWHQALVSMCLYTFNKFHNWEMPQNCEKDCCKKAVYNDGVSLFVQYHTPKDDVNSTGLTNIILLPSLAEGHWCNDPQLYELKGKHHTTWESVRVKTSMESIVCTIFLLIEYCAMWKICVPFVGSGTSANETSSASSDSKRLITITGASSLSSEANTSEPDNSLGEDSNYPAKKQHMI